MMWWEWIKYWSVRGRMRGRDSEFGMDMYTLLSLKWITKKDLLYSTWNSTQCYMAAWTEMGFDGECKLYMYG